MKTIRIVILSFLTLVAVFGGAQTTSPAEPVITFKVPVSRVNQVIYAIRYTQIMDAKTANELADFLVAQANDTTLNRPQPTIPPRQLRPDTTPFPAKTGTDNKSKH